MKRTRLWLVSALSLAVCSMVTLWAIPSMADSNLEVEDQESRIRALEEEIRILKVEIDRQHQRAEDAESRLTQVSDQETEHTNRLEADLEAARKAQTQAEASRQEAVSRLKADLEAVRKAQAQAEASRQETVSRLQADLEAARETLVEKDRQMETLKAEVIDEARARELTEAMESMREVDAQRKSAMDDLFRQQAALKKEVAARESDLAAARDALEEARARIADGQALQEKYDEQMAVMEQRLAQLQAERDSARERQSALEATLQVRERTIADGENTLQALRTEMERVRRVDDQRRQTLDETLASLAEARQQLGETTRELEQVRTAAETTLSENTGTIEALSARNQMLDREILQMEQDVSAARTVRDEALEQVRLQTEALASRDRDVADLEAQVSRLSEIDEQRRKTMDRILLDVAALEKTHARQQEELQRLRETQADSPETAVPTVPDPAVEDLRRQNETLTARIAELEVATQAEAMDAVSTPVPVPIAPEASAWAQDKAHLETRIQDLQDAASRDAEEIRSLREDLERTRAESADLAMQIKALEGRKPDIRESDLYKDLEQINATLREKMIEIEAERQRLARSSGDAEALAAEQTRLLETEKQARETAETRLSEALEREAEYKELIERLVPQVEDLERQVAELAGERQQLIVNLRQRDADLEALKTEIERREHRLAKAERVAEVLEKARTEVMQAGDREKLNMHYNMASVYARDGKFTEAEQEYLQALRIDPTDADVHYNLGILYDDELKQPEKAVLHYRRYLQLAPHGPDADRVRTWLMKLEMRSGN